MRQGTSRWPRPTFSTAPTAPGLREEEEADEVADQESLVVVNREDGSSYFWDGRRYPQARIEFASRPRIWI